jgi:methionyl-tRNA formyltransferase
VKVCLLGEKAFERLTPIIHDQFPDTIFNTNEVLTGKLIENTDLFVSYGYRHIITRDMLKSMKRPPVNLHISLLPWNRGADPNLWSWIDNTPKGVTIHLMDHELDKGEIIAQRQIEMDTTYTLASSYDRLCKEMERLFKEQWSKIRFGDFKTFPAMGSYHRSSDKENVPLTDGWNTHVSMIVGAKWK